MDDSHTGTGTSTGTGDGVDLFGTDLLGLHTIISLIDGAITINGQNVGPDLDNNGVIMRDAEITSVNGPISITGTSLGDDGVDITDVLIESTGTGTGSPGYDAKYRSLSWSARRSLARLA